MPEPAEPGAAGGGPTPEMQGPLRRGYGTAVDDAPRGQEEAHDSWRSRMNAAAARRGIPIGTILTTVLVAVGILDLNALVVLLFWVLRSLVLSILVAGFVAMLLSPPVRALERRGFHRAVASVLVCLAAAFMIGGVIVLFTAPLVSNINHLAHELPDLVRQAEKGRGWLGHTLKRLHLQRVVSQNLPKLSQDLTKSLKPAQALSLGTAAFSTVVSLSVIAVMAFFMLLEAPKMWTGVMGLLSPPRAARVTAVYNEASRSVTGYVLGNFLTSVIAGVVVFVTLTILGVPFAWLLGVWVALVDLLPLVGGLLAGVPVVLIAFLHSVTAGIVVIVVFLAYQTIENHLLNPIIMSRTVRLNPLWVLLSVLIAASLGGRLGSFTGAFIGALLGIPIGGAIQVTVREIRKGPGPVGETTGPAMNGELGAVGPPTSRPRPADRDRDRDRDRGPGADGG